MDRHHHIPKTPDLVQLLQPSLTEEETLTRLLHRSGGLC
jgi:hypothetical protein